MRYWWVNQNQTHRQEIGGGYLWSPKRSAHNVRNPFYETMREVAPGELVGADHPRDGPQGSELRERLEATGQLI
jgi:hypothetical protein